METKDMKELVVYLFKEGDQIVATGRIGETVTAISIDDKGMSLENIAMVKHLVFSVARSLSFIEKYGNELFAKCSEEGFNAKNVPEDFEPKILPMEVSEELIKYVKFIVPPKGNKIATPFISVDESLPQGDKTVPKLYAILTTGSLVSTNLGELGFVQSFDKEGVQVKIGLQTQKIEFTDIVIPSENEYLKIQRLAAYNATEGMRSLIKQVESEKITCNCEERCRIKQHKDTIRNYTVSKMLVCKKLLSDIALPTKVEEVIEAAK